MADLDLLILGGGCAGLSLGLRLAEKPKSGQTLILEARRQYTNDRTWCFWRQQPHRFQHLVSCSWSAMAVSAPGRRVIFNCQRTPYELIPADRFYAEAQSGIARSSNVTLRCGSAVHAPPRLSGGLWRVETTEGPLTARRIVDTRPSRARYAAESLLWQSFFGQEVECTAARFDPATAELMQFDVTRTGDVLFSYVLPSSLTSALIETTIFGPHKLGAADLAVLQAGAVARLCGDAQTRILRTESGVLPMGLSPCAKAPAAGYVHAGLMSGAARPSTGYAFQRIQRWADACADSLASGGPAIGHAAEPILRREMDRLFLRVLRAHPERGPEIFTRMFGDAGPDRVIRFLSDTGTITDCACLGARLPIGLFLGELAKSLVRPPTARSTSTAAIGAWHPAS